MPSVDVMLLALLVFPYCVNSNDAQPSLRKLGQGPELFLQTWTNELDADPWVEQTGCKLQQTENEAICGGEFPFKDKASASRGASMQNFIWQVDCTEMKERRGDDSGTFALHIGVPSFKAEEPSNSFQCARVQYKVSCKPESGQADCKAMWANASSGMQVTSGGATSIYLIAGQVVDIFCDVMLADAPVNVWLSDSRVEVKLEIGAGFAKNGEKIHFQPSMESDLTKMLISVAKFKMVHNDPDQCYKALKEDMQWMALQTEASTSNSATVRLLKYGGQSKLKLSSGCVGCTEMVVTHPMDIRAVLPQIDCKITDVKVVTGDTTQPPEVLLRSAFLGPPRPDVESTFLEFLRDIVIDPARLPPETKAISVTVNRIVDGGSISTRGVLTESIAIVGATGESIVYCDEGSAHIVLTVAVILLSIVVAGLLVMLWRKHSNPPLLAQDGLEMPRLEG